MPPQYSQDILTQLYAAGPDDRSAAGDRAERDQSKEYHRSGVHVRRASARKARRGGVSRTDGEETVREPTGWACALYSLGTVRAA